MSAPFRMSGSYTYESPQVRALGGITPESYDYRDQGKTISKLVNDVSYMAGMQRKMQEGIDAANQNILQQIQSLVNDIIVILGGGGDTGWDFGDLKYIFQAFGALFGFEPGGLLPINLFEAAWHFFSNYIIPFNNWEVAFDEMIDNIIATMLSWFGEIPIVGQAVQQFMVWLSNVRDLILIADDIIDEIETFIYELFNFNLGQAWNAGQAVWDLFSSHLFPNIDFDIAIRSIVDQFFATILNIFGEIPIVGLAIEQMANIIQGARDLFDWLNDLVQTFFRNLWGFFGFNTTAKTTIATIGDLISRGVSFVQRLLGIEDDSLTGLTNANPAVVALDGRVAVLEAEAGSWSDNMNRTALGTAYNNVRGNSSDYDMDGSFIVGKDGGYAGLYVREQFTTSRTYAQWTIQQKFGYWGPSCFHIMSTLNMSSFVGLRVYTGFLGIGSGMQIVTGSGSTIGGLTNRGSFYYRGWKVGDTVGIGYDPASKQYIGYLNNQVVLSWADPTSIVPTGSSNRWSGFILGLDVFQDGPGIDEWSAYDWN